MPPEKHALLSASSASRWLKCTAAPRFEEGLPENTSEYAEEGRLAHAIGELKVLKKCTPMSTRTYNTRLNKLKKNPLYDPEMDKTTDLYLEHITEQVMDYDSAPTVAVEVRVDFSDYVPEGFGTCDCCIIGGDLLSITDYKHGKGVPVSAVGNPQMKLYALGALRRYAAVFGDTIKRVRMTIDQPRLDSYTTDEITVEELRAWGESIKPIAQRAFSGLGEFVPGDHCRFCRGKAQCRARARVNTALEDFKDCVPAGSIPADAMVPQEHSHTGAITGEEVHPLLSDEEIGDLLERGAQLVQWYKDLEAYTVTFTKAVYEASITLAEPMDADDAITVMVLNVLGSIPADADLEVLVTNNANDTEPVWEDATQDVKNGNNHVFTNQTAANGFAFNFKVNVGRGTSNTGGYITSIGGAFQ